MDEKKNPCPMCNSPNQTRHEGDFEICRVCGWENDDIQLDYPDETGANKMTFNEARAKLARGEKIYSDFPKE